MYKYEYFKTFLVTEKIVTFSLFLLMFTLTSITLYPPFPIWILKKLLKMYNILCKLSIHRCPWSQNINIQWIQEKYSITLFSKLMLLQNLKNTSDSKQHVRIKCVCVHVDFLDAKRWTGLIFSAENFFFKHSLPLRSSGGCLNHVVMATQHHEILVATWKGGHPHFFLFTWKTQKERKQPWVSVHQAKISDINANILK